MKTGCETPAVSQLRVLYNLITSELVPHNFSHQGGARSLVSKLGNFSLSFINLLSRHITPTKDFDLAASILL